MTPALANRIGVFPQAQQTAAARAASDWRLKLIVCAPLLGATVLSKFAIPPFGAQGFGLIFPMIFLGMLYGLATGRMQFAWRRLLLFFVMLSVLGLMQVLRGELFSISSVVLMAVLGLSYVVTGRATADGRGYDNAQMLDFFRNLTLLIAVAGILQAIALAIGGPHLGFPIENYVPSQFQTLGYNNITVLRYGSHTYKSTGIFMLEPSMFSQLTALGVVAELAGRARLLRLLIYAGGLMVAYSGTGLLILAVALPLYVVLYRRWNLLVPGAVILVGVLLLAEPLQLHVLMDRTGEFSRTGTSGFARFVGWRELFADRLWNSPLTALFGNGAGSFAAGAIGYSAAEMSYSKIIFEFGVIGSLLYFAFLFYCMLSSRAPLIVRIAMLVCWFLNGAYAPTVAGIILSVLLWPSGQEQPVDKVVLPLTAPDRQRELA